MSRNKKVAQIKKPLQNTCYNLSGWKKSVVVNFLYFNHSAAVWDSAHVLIGFARKIGFIYR